jgi:renalase
MRSGWFGGSSAKSAPGPFGPGWVPRYGLNQAWNCRFRSCAWSTMNAIGSQPGDVPSRLPVSHCDHGAYADGQKASPLGRTCTKIALWRGGRRIMAPSVPGHTKGTDGRRVQCVTVIVVGAGIAGLACARELVDAGVAARILERSPVVGGRLASRRINDRYADIGAAYVTADHPAFEGRLQSWRIDGLAHPWTDTFQVYGAEPATGPMRWSAPGGLHSLAEDLARELDVTLGYEVTALPDDATTVVLAMPGPQALRIADLAAAREQTWSPALTAVLTYPGRAWADFHGMFVNDHPILATICDDGDRRGDRAPVLVAHSTAGFAQPRLSDPATAAGALAGAVGELLGIADTPQVHVHRWTYAQPAPGTGLFARAGNVYLAGDAFGRPRVQTAWLSGRAVARAILQSTER